ncbi:choline uptake/conversion transcriptional regulator CudC [Paenactinomyces guangxiensis]|uniref:HTH-type transcriptional regulator n=1 Tax=Paenactinomyces guangxiensis TaxID=1490290 RepID=A0A7W2A6A0_9BACL|nr:GbsR/MarR family transcriptional regulator [Paenactinomyces guangxiensis]MBA4493141.1 GbsR/MarR family transcriptional regulator [Paenactinomyces guangxiensis]MBH8590009.1 GbsR/MarR family transcriptional regulator [Paenactinomyces guangxiensis]
MNGLERIQKARNRVIESIAKNMDLYGVSPSMGRLYGITYFNDAPMTLEEMSQALGMSKTSMSAGVRFLSDLNMVEKVWVKGQRKDLYQAEQDWYQTFIDFFCIKWRKGIEMNREAIRRSLVELNQVANDHDVEEEIREMAGKDIQKLHQALAYYEWLSRLVDSFETHEIFNFIPKPDSHQNP